MGSAQRCYAQLSGTGQCRTDWSCMHLNPIKFPSLGAVNKQANHFVQYESTFLCQLCLLHENNTASILCFSIYQQFFQLRNTSSLGTDYSRAQALWAGCPSLTVLIPHFSLRISHEAGLKASEMSEVCGLH